MNIDNTDLAILIIIVFFWVCGFLVGRGWDAIKDFIKEAFRKND